MGDIEKILSEQTYQRLATPTGLPRGLPNAAFTSDEFFRLECERLFPRQWVFVGHTHDIPNPGDISPVSVGGIPILLVRGRDGEIRAFHNACRHRGMKLYDEPQCGKAVLTCPYHAWAYDLDGRLRTTPHFGGFRREAHEGFDPGQFSLKPVRCAHWKWWICVNLDGEAPPFEDAIGPILQRVGDYDFDRLTPAIRMDFGVIKGNWKSIVENYIEPYHVYLVHSQSCGGQPIEAHFVVNDGTLVGSGVNLPEAPPIGHARKTSEGGYDRERLEDNALYLVLFPNLALGFYGDVVLSILTRPLAAAETWERFDLYLPHEIAEDPVALEAWRSLNERINSEDIAMVEKLQEGLASPVMKEGAAISAHWEHCIQQFEKLVLEAVKTP